MQLGNGGATGSVAGNIADSAALAFDRSDNFTFTGVISGIGSLSQIGGGILTLGQAPGYSGNTTVSAGTLVINNSSVPGASIAVASGATLQYNTSSGTVFQSGTTLTGGGTLRKTGGSFLVFGSGGIVNVNLSAGAVIDVEGGTLNGSSNYQGNWTTNQASLNIAGGAAYDAVEGGTSFTQRFDALSGAGTLRGGFSGNPSGVTTLTFGVANGSGTFSGSICDSASGNLAIIKSGGGTQALSGSGTYTGGTTVAAGTLPTWRRWDDRDRSRETSTSTATRLSPSPGQM